MPNPTIVRHIDGGLSHIKTFQLTADEIQNVVDWYIQHNWTKIDEDNPDTLPIPFESVQLYVPDKAPLPTVMEGYMDDDWLFHSIRVGENFIEPTHWCPMTPPPQNKQTESPL